MITIQQFQKLLGAGYISDHSRNGQIDHVLIDSRKLIFTEKSLFIAIKGERNNSHQYLEDVYQAGVRLFVIEKNNYNPEIISKFEQATIIETDNGIRALQLFAKIYRSQFTLETIAITGSNGKTIVKEWLNHLLKDTHRIVRSPKSYNSQIGVPLSVLQIGVNHNLGIFEAGISEPDEMLKLEQIIHPDFGIFTMLGEAHNEGFESPASKLNEKALLFKRCKKVIYCEEQIQVYSFFESQNTSLINKKYYSWSRINPQADYYIQTEQLGSNTRLICNGISVLIPFSDEASVWNACSCLASLFLLDINVATVVSKFIDLPVLDMRLQLKEGRLNTLLINDSYSADLGSLKIALDLLNQQAATKKRTVIISDFLESGRTETELYAEISKQLIAFKIDQLIGVGEVISRNAGEFNVQDMVFFENTDSFISEFIPENLSGHIVLIKGARSFAFEKISHWLEKKVHQTVFEVNLNTLIENLNVYRSMLNPGVKTMAMVKAFSYGSGSFEVARMLSFNRVDYLTVAYADEGVVLREAGIKTPIMVMNPEPSSFDAIFQYNLEPEIYNFEILDALIHAADGEEVGIHMELDSGMKRLGFDAHQLPQLVAILKSNEQFKIRSVFTHLAASEDELQDEFTLNQIEKFKIDSHQILGAFTYPILLHCLNTGGITRFKDAQLDMVRLGIGLYGVNPTNQPMQIKPVGTLKTVISQIRMIDSNESIGYGRRGRLNASGKIAIVAIGYADGLDRKLSNGVGSLLINGKFAPIVGSICMDMTMVDVSNIDCRVGDEVIVFGDNPSILEVSGKLGTIPYEILTNISQRVKRVFYV